MLDYFVVLTTGGIVLWRTPIPGLKMFLLKPVSTFVKKIIIEELSTGEFEFRELKLQGMRDDKYGLIFVAAYQSTVPALYVELFLKDFKDRTPAKFQQQLEAKDLKSKCFAMEEFYATVLREADLRNFQMSEQKRISDMKLKLAQEALLHSKTDSADGKKPDKEVTVFWESRKRLLPSTSSFSVFPEDSNYNRRHRNGPSRVFSSTTDALSRASMKLYSFGLKLHSFSSKLRSFASILTPRVRSRQNVTVDPRFWSGDKPDLKKFGEPSNGEDDAENDNPEEDGDPCVPA